MDKLYYAHTPASNEPDGEWHVLTDHLGEVARLACAFAGKFRAGELAYWAGWMHDIGKFSSEFQQYLRECCQASQNGKKPPSRRVNHSSAGAIHAQLESFPGLAYPIAGHHAGLSDVSEMDGRLHERRSDASVQEAIRMGKDVIGNRLPQLSEATVDSLSEWIHDEYDLEILLRMIFSALVDADYLDTERHFRPDLAHVRGFNDVMPSLWEKLEQAQDSLMASAHEGKVNDVRRDVYESCLKSAEQGTGVFSLTVPTGGGKTRSSLAFALKHVLHNKLDRVIVAIPYTSIIDQTVEEYRKIFGEDQVVEHHSGTLVEDEERQDPDSIRQRLATENWDAPIVVTTTVQLFESLFANRANRCRKLHNIARSVVIIDEVQTLPPELISPILDVLRRMVENYRVSLVLCTATQPAMEVHSRFLRGFSSGSVTEIVPNYTEHFNSLKRVEYKVVDEEWGWEEVARKMHEMSQALVVLNTRKDALELLQEFQAEDGEDWYHLSTLLCGKHRKEILETVRKKLKNDRPCRLISTQVVEAGVDLNFPLVLRAFGPLDRIVQAAGRCNREGRLNAPGQVIVFNPMTGRTPRGPYRTAIDVAKKHLGQRDVNLNNPEIFKQYFNDLYSSVYPDQFDIQSDRKRMAYRTVAGKFKMIDAETKPVFVQYDKEACRLLDKARFGGMSKNLLRQMQPYMVNLFDQDLRHAATDGLIEEVVPGFFLWQGGYSKKEGLTGIVHNPADLSW